MAFKNFMAKLRRAILCCGAGERKRSLEISSPTDVRHVDLDICMPGLSKEERDYIREKASADAHRLLSLQSHPPTRPPSQTPSNVNSQPESVVSSREPSATLLNAASSNLPTNVPTPPRQQHSDSNLPIAAGLKMKSIWERTRRLSASLGSNHGGYRDLTSATKSIEEEGEGLVLLELDSKELESPVSGKSTIEIANQNEGFEAQEVTGGKAVSAPLIRNANLAKPGTSIKRSDETSSDEESGPDAPTVRERRPLVAS